MDCKLCPVECGADRAKRAGRCGVTGLTIAKYGLHPYEEPPISHAKGAGAVFFGGCGLRCVFCQNYEVSRAMRGKAVTPKELSAIFTEIEDMGADCIDLVTPDHVSDLVAEALSYRKPKVPVVYNSGGYAKLDALERIAPYVDIWLPDLKFCDPALSLRYTRRADYFEYASRAVAFMAKTPIVSEDGAMQKGIIVRHLVLPGCGSDSMKVLDFLKTVLPEDAPLSLMRQYTPMGDIAGFPELQRRVTAREYNRVLGYAEMLGFSTIYAQEKESASEFFVPIWDF